jgi:hypothetical protein
MIASRAIAVSIRHPAAVRLQRPTRPLQRPPRPLHRPAMPLRRPVSRRQTRSLLPAAILVLKLVAAALAGATATLVLWQDERKPVAQYSLESDRFATAVTPGRQESTVYRSAPQWFVGGSQPVSTEPAPERVVPSNFPVRVRTVSFTPPAGQPLPPTANRRVGPAGNVLAGKPLRYLIGTGAAGPGRDDEVTEVAYSAAPVKRGISIAYCNLFDEYNTRRYGPYLRTSDTAAQYNEGQIDPRGPGWEKNLREQFERRKKQGFEYIELDNPDAYSIKDVIGAIDLAATYGLKVIAKNPGLMGRGAAEYVAHANIYGIIVEKGAGGAADMDALRRKAGKPELPVWFVAFGSGRGWAGNVANAAKQYRNMGVTYSSSGEYGNAIDVLVPTESTRSAGLAAR